MRSFKTLYAIAFLAFGLFTDARAQGGKVHGQVTDRSNGETIIGATVMLEGTKIGKVTDLEGRYVIQDVPTGLYNVVVSYVSYSKQVFKNIQVSEGKDVVLNVSLSEAFDTLKTVEIKGSIGQNTTTSMMLFQQKNSGTADVISSDQMKKSPDKTTGEVLKRVSGATIQDNKFVIIRGLSDRYNTALINGLPLPTTEPDRKAFSFDIFPSAMLDNLIIFKTASPDLPGDFAGGVIQLSTRDIPEENFLSFSSGTGINTQSTFKEYKTYAGGKYDWLGIDDGTRSIPDGVPDSKTYKDMLNSPLTRYSASKLFKNDWAISPESSSPLSQSYQLSFGSNCKVLKNDFGIIGAIMYNNTRKTVDVLRSDFNVDTSRIYSYHDMQYKQNVSTGAMLNLTYKIGERNKLSLKNMISNTGEDMVVERTGKDFEKDQLIKAYSTQFTTTRLYSTQLSGEHFIKKGEVRIKWGGTYSNIWRDTPNLKRMYYNTQPGAASDAQYYAYVPSGSPSASYAGKYFSVLNEDLYSGNADITVPFKLFKQKQLFKTGGSTVLKDRSFDARVFGYVVANQLNFDQSLLTHGLDSLFDEKNIGSHGFRLVEATNPDDSYKASSSLYTAYVMFDNKICKKLRMVWGARYENFNQTLNIISLGGDTIALDTTYINILPSVNFTWIANEKTNIRLSASRTVARPEFREISPFAFYDFNTSSSAYGNPKLNCTNITNLDARFETYPGLNQLFSFSVFYKDFKNPIEQIVDASSGAGSRTFTFQNVIRAENYGVETEARFKLSCFDSLLHWKQWDNLTWFTNLSYIYSKVDLSNVASVTDGEKVRPLQGQSPYIINTGMQYMSTEGKLGFSLLFNRIGRRIAQVGSNGYLAIYEAPRNLLDFQVSYKFSKYIECRINMSDILNNEQIFYQDQNGSKKYEADQDTRITGIHFGSNYSISLSCKF